MKIILLMVESVDGKTTKGTIPNTAHLSSPEDQRHFYSLLEQNSLLIMGSKTYNAAKHLMEHRPGKLRVVFTHDLQNYQTEKIPGQLEFTSEDPKTLITRLEKAGYTQALLLGGATLAGQFLEAGLLTHLSLTIEPKIFAKGNPLIIANELDIDLQLLSIEKINQKGTLLVQYTVTK